MWTPQAAPSPMSSEVVVFVLTPLGQQIGSFVWPRAATPLLELCNGSTHGNYFVWNETNNMKKNMQSKKLKITSKQGDMLNTLLWRTTKQ